MEHSLTPGHERTGLHRLTLDDLDALLALQAETLPDTLSARFGASFNALYHRAMLGDDLYYCDGYFIDGALVGYLSYTPDTSRLLRQTFKRNAFLFLRTLALAVVTRPRCARLIGRIAASTWAAGGRAESERIGAELLSIGVLPGYRGRLQAVGSTSNVAGSLLARACAVLASRGALTVTALVKPNDPVANAFYLKHGFEFQRPVRRFGTVASMYVRVLAQPAATHR